MRVGLLIIAHERLGSVLLETATGTLNHCPLNAEILSVCRDCDPEELRQRAQMMAKRLNKGEGVLVLTDMYGSTPSNVACSLLKQPGVEVVAGLNLPMLIRILNYPDLELSQLAQKAVSGGTDGIMRCERGGA
jgi:mannose PTS system EIIA component